jgi:Rrf2 family iron-sulfur cluster assembly transcriptional regulator
MRLSTKGRYAVMAMADLARREGALGEGDRAVSLAEIAARQQISLSYLEQLFARLRRRGLVISARGPGGGYRLARDADATNIADIVLAVDEPLRATRCSAKGKGCMLKGERCLTHELWEEMGRQLQSYLASVSLADVVSGRLSADREAA